jgi:hypothetical protein
VGRTLVANKVLACSACGKRHRGRPLNSVVSRHMTTHPGICEHCGQSFRFSFIGGMNGSFHAYCEQCGKAIVSESLVDPLKIKFEPCQCGGEPSYDASPRCPHCNRALSAEIAASYIEREAPPGYRWQRTWKNGTTFVIEGKLSYNHPWKKVKGKWFQWM